MVEKAFTNGYESARKGGYTCGLKQVVENDFLPTQMLLREIYFGDKFKPNEFNGLLKGLQWLKTPQNLSLFESVDGDSKFLPNFVRDFRLTIKLFFELEHEIKTGKNEVYLNIPVAFASHDSKEKLVTDLENTTYETWLKFRDEPGFKSPDALCTQMFRAYWFKLKLRALILK